MNSCNFPDFLLHQPVGITLVGPSIRIHEGISTAQRRGNQRRQQRIVEAVVIAADGFLAVRREARRAHFEGGFPVQHHPPAFDHRPKFRDAGQSGLAGRAGRDSGIWLSVRLVVVTPAMPEVAP